MLSHGKHGTYDVGFFEVANDDAEAIQRAPIGLERIAAGTVQSGRNTYIYGFPRDYVQLRGEGRVRELPSASITYSQPLLDPVEWPEVGSGARKPDRQVDCFVRYSMADEMRRTVSGTPRRRDRLDGIPETLPEAFGMSGGGFWQSSKPKELFLHPLQYGLIAIQSSWDSRREYLRGIGIRHWLELVCDEFDDLKPLIDSHLTAKD